MFFLVFFVSNLAPFSPFRQAEQGKRFGLRFRLCSLIVVGCLVAGGSLETPVVVEVVFYGEGEAVHGVGGGARRDGEVGE